MAVETKLGAEKPPSNKDGQMLPLELVEGAHGDVSLERSARLSSITKEQSLVARFTGADVLRSFNYQNDNCGVDVITPVAARHTVATVGAMCTLQGLLCNEATLERPGGPRED